MLIHKVRSEFMSTPSMPKAAIPIDTPTATPIAVPMATPTMVPIKMLFSFMISDFSVSVFALIFDTSKFLSAVGVHLAEIRHPL